MKRPAYTDDCYHKYGKLPDLSQFLRDNQSYVDWILRKLRSLRDDNERLKNRVDQLEGYCEGSTGNVPEEEEY